MFFIRDLDNISQSKIKMYSVEKYPCSRQVHRYEIKLIELHIFSQDLKLRVLHYHIFPGMLVIMLKRWPNASDAASILFSRTILKFLSYAQHCLSPPPHTKIWHEIFINKHLDRHLHLSSSLLRTDWSDCQAECGKMIIIMLSSYIAHIQCSVRFTHISPLITGPVHWCTISTPFSEHTAQPLWR